MGLTPDGDVGLDLVPDRHASELGRDGGARAGDDDEGGEQGAELPRDHDDEDRIHELALAELGEEGGADEVDGRADGQGHGRGDAEGLDPGEEDLHHEDVGSPPAGGGRGGPTP